MIHDIQLQPISITCGHFLFQDFVQKKILPKVDHHKKDKLLKGKGYSIYISICTSSHIIKLDSTSYGTKIFLILILILLKVFF